MIIYQHSYESIIQLYIIDKTTHFSHQNISRISISHNSDHRTTWFHCL